MPVFPYDLMVRAWLGCGWLLFWLWLPINQAGAEVLTLTQAEVTLTLPGLPASASAPVTVELPYHWDIRHPGVGGCVLPDAVFP